MRRVAVERSVRGVPDERRVATSVRRPAVLERTVLPIPDPVPATITELDVRKRRRRRASR